MSYAKRLELGFDVVDMDGVVSPVLVRSEYAYDRDAVSRETGLKCDDPSRARQEFAEDADINTIVRRFGLTGQLPEAPIKVPISADYVDVVSDYRSALDIVIQADRAFMELPADTRARFANDPQQLMMFVENPANLDEARRLGLAVPAPVVPPKPEPMEVRVVDPAK